MQACRVWAGRLPGHRALYRLFAQRGPARGCPTTSTAKSTTSTATSVAVALPPPETGALEKDWKSFGGTAYYGCPEQFALGKSALDNIRPKIFDPKTGQYVTPAVPMIVADDNLTGAICTLSTHWMR